MAWAEQSGDNTWRVRYRRADNTIGSIPGFPDETTALDHAHDIESDQRRGQWRDPVAGRTTLNEFLDQHEWLDSLDIDSRTEDNYRSILKTTSHTAGATTRWTTSPTTKSSPGRRNSAAKAWRASPSTASSRCSR